MKNLRKGAKERDSLPEEIGKSEILVYKTDDGRIKIDVRLEEETVWFTQ